MKALSEQQIKAISRTAANSCGEPQNVEVFRLLCKRVFALKGTANVRFENILAEAERKLPFILKCLSDYRDFEEDPELMVTLCHRTVAELIIHEKETWDFVVVDADEGWAIDTTVQRVEVMGAVFVER